ncbi:hypothetical protein [Chloroflexus sp.]|uniref:hypothetical protein n=1 Tax=Chloroflexus sp. TaxID=1904827 RepID=UPI002ADE4A56|nr:hypothetical protein [Chloroflexus sp.]
MNACQLPTTIYPAPGPLAEHSSGRFITYWIVVALPARHARDAAFGVRQLGCRTSHTHNPARGTSLPLLVTAMLWVIVTFIESVRSE